MPRTPGGLLLAIQLTVCVGESEYLPSTRSACSAILCCKDKRLATPHPAASGSEQMEAASRLSGPEAIRTGGSLTMN